VDEIMNPLENNLSESDLETAMTNGRSLELDQVVTELLDTFSNN
jgi:hypothetical protein